MTKAECLAQLRRSLAGMGPREIDEIIADYGAHFDEATAAGRSEADVAQALGDPQRLAREVRAESRIRRWESQRTPSALVGAVFGILGLLALDLLIIAPLVFGIGVAILATGFAFFIVAIVGIAILFGDLHVWHGTHMFAHGLAQALGGIGLFGLAIGVLALLWLVMEMMVRLLGRYARLHYRVLRPAEVST